MQKLIESLGFAVILAFLLIADPSPSFSQGTPGPPAPSRAPVGVPPTLPPTAGVDMSEKSLKVDPNVNLSLCVTQGTVTVNSWRRNELRVFVHDGSKFGFKVSQKSEKTGDPVWVMVFGLEAKKKYAVPTECISGGDVEIDVPANAAVNIKGEDVNTNIDGVRKAKIEVSGGSISVRNIAQGVTAKTYQGGVAVEESKGPMDLETTNGNIVVFEAGPGEIGDTFTARTNGGTISLQRVEHRQLDVKSISGTVAYNGAILSGGTYNLTTTNGSIRMAIPQNSVCRVTATFSEGRFETEMPFTVEQETVQPGTKTVIGKFGDGGDAIIKLISSIGSIAIRKQ